MESQTVHSSAHDTVETVRPLATAHEFAGWETVVNDTLLGLIAGQNTEGGPVWSPARRRRRRIMLGRLADLEAKMAIARRLAEIEEGQEAARLRRAARVTASAHPIVAQGPQPARGTKAMFWGRRRLQLRGLPHR